MPLSRQVGSQMKVAILAGGAGLRMSRETEDKPKPMVDVGGMPIIWHIMKYYRHFGYRDFVVALGYRGDVLKEFFSSNADRIESSMNSSCVKLFDTKEDWNLELVETGLTTNTGGRIKRLRPYLDGETFLLTWGDGLADVDLNKLVDFHRRHGKAATVTAVHPPGRFGCLDLNGNSVQGFVEKGVNRNEWINGAFFVLEPSVFELIDDDQTAWEAKPMQELVAAENLMAWKHESFWQCMDSLKDRNVLEELWQNESAPWKVWN